MKFIRYGLFGLVASALILSAVEYNVGKPVRALRAQIENVRSEPAAYEMLGPPTEVIYPGEEAGFVRAGHPCAARPIIDHALVYDPAPGLRDGFSDVTLFLYVNADLSLGGYEICGT